MADSLVRPLLVRPGARFSCFSDGLCCTDIHALGPLTRPEVRRLRLISEEAVVRHPDLLEPVFRTKSDGSCLFLHRNRCRIHATFGPAAKPEGCRRFPFGLVATPAGGRITTEHRCPCRTLGDRKELSVSEAESSLRADSGRLVANGRAGQWIHLDARRKVRFGDYQEFEARIFERFERGDAVLDVLRAKPLPRMRALSWKKVGHYYRASLDGTQYGEALVWFGDGLLSLCGEPWRKLRPRPWEAAFDRAEKRSRNPMTMEAVLKDWASDVIWGLDWVDRGSFSRARKELGVRYSVANAIARRLRKVGVRGDRAAAEALMIVELSSAAPLWTRVVRAFPATA